MDIPKELSNAIIVRKDGLYRHTWDAGQELNQVKNLLDWLRMEIYVEDGITFEDFFNHIMVDYERVSEVFYSHLGGYSLADWLDEWNTPDPMKDIEDEEIDTLEVYWSVEQNNFNQYKRPEIEEWVGFHGKGRHRSSDAYGDDELHDTAFSFSMTKLNEMKHYPFSINEEWNIFNGMVKPEDMKNLEGDDWYILKAHKSMTVYDVIAGILDDISFYGSPTERDDKSNELQEQVQRIKDGIEPMSEYESAEDFITQLKENIEKRKADE